MSMNTHQMSQVAANAAADTGDTKEEQKAKAKTATDLVAEKFEEHFDKLAAQLGRAIDPKQFLASTVNAIARDPNLIRALNESPRTVIGGVYQAAQCGFEVNSPLGNAYLIARHAKDKVASDKAGRAVFKWQANFQLGYKGVKELAYRSGEIAYIDAEAVYEKDFFEYQLGTEHYLRHIPYDGINPGKVVKYYAIVTLKNGEPLFKVWQYDKVLAHAKQFASSYNAQKDQFYGPWATNFDSMAKKTVLLDCLNFAPKSMQLALRLAADNTVKSIPLDKGTDINMLMSPNETPFEVEAEDGGESKGEGAGELDIGKPEIQASETQDGEITGESAAEVAARLGMKKGAELEVPRAAKRQKVAAVAHDDAQQELAGIF